MGRHTLGGGPAANLASEVNADNLRALQLPRKISHDVNGIGTADTAGNHAETSSVGSMRIRSNHETTGEGIVFKDNLVDDTRAWLPEADTVLEIDVRRLHQCVGKVTHLGSRSSQEVVDLLVNVDSAREILGTANLGLNKMVAVDGGGDSGSGHARRHELEQGHLRSRILARNAVGAQLEVAHTTSDVLVCGIVEMSVKDLLR